MKSGEMISRIWHKTVLFSHKLRQKVSKYFSGAAMYFSQNVNIKADGLPYCSLSTVLLINMIPPIILINKTVDKEQKGKPSAFIFTF